MHDLSRNNPINTKNMTEEVLLPRPQPSRLARMLFYVTPNKVREQASEKPSGLISAVKADLKRRRTMEGKDDLSLEAMEIVSGKPYNGKGETYAEVMRLMLARAQGRINELEAVLHRMRCHEAHLEQIIARQDGELKQLRK